MARPMIGVDIDDFRLETKAALRQASALQLRAIEVPTSEGALAPANLSTSGRRHLSRFAEGLGLHLSALNVNEEHVPATFVVHRDLGNKDSIHVHPRLRVLQVGQGRLNELGHVLGRVLGAQMKRGQRPLDRYAAHHVGHQPRLARGRTVVSEFRS